MGDDDPRAVVGDLESYRGYLRAILWRYFGEGRLARDDLSDLVQQTMARAWARRDQFRGTGRFQHAAWLRTILVSELVDARRRAGRDPARLAIEQAVERSSVGLDGWLVDDATSPPDRAERADTLRIFGEWVDALPTAWARALRLRLLEGKALDEIAALMGCTAPSAAGHLRRGLDELKRRHPDLLDRLA